MLNSLTSKTISPVKATLWALPVKFCHLWKIRAPLHQVEGFDVKHFDDIILNACNVSDADVEPQPLWEYPNFALSSPQALMTFEFNKKLPQEVISRKVVFDGLETSEKGTGVVLFMDWNLTSKIVVTPLDRPVVRGEKICWNKHTKQGVHFFIQTDEKESKILKHIEVILKFQPQDGDLSFSFHNEVV